MTPAVIAAQRAGMAFRLLEYRHDPTAGSYGLEAAEKLGLPPARVFKTLVVTLDAGALAVALVPVICSLDLKAVAATLGGRRAAMADPAAAERASGYVTGGISPLGLKRRLAVVVDSSATAAEGPMYVSAGRRGLELELLPEELLRVTGGVLAPVARCG